MQVVLKRMKKTKGQDETAPYQPCQCKEGCKVGCSCLRDGHFCEKFCACGPECVGRWKGCVCKGGCRGKGCPCLAAGWSCSVSNFSILLFSLLFIMFIMSKRIHHYLKFCLCLCFFKIIIVIKPIVFHLSTMSDRLSSM